MPKESRTAARARAKRLGFPLSQVVSAGRGKSYYIAPRGVTTAAGKKAYASLRSKGASKVKAAKII